MKHLEAKMTLRSELYRYWRIWYQMASNGLAQLSHTKFGAALFVLGKLFRFAFFTVLIVRVLSETTLVSGYTLEQMVFVFLTFNIVDISTQMLFRGVYLFRSLIVSGNFDFILTKPMSPLFRSLMSNADILDFIVFVPLVLGTGWYLARHALFADPLHLVWYLVLLINGFLISFAFHVLVLALGVVTTEVDSAIMLYRDLTSMGRVPIDVYQQPLRSFVTFVVPVGVMMTFPAKALFGEFGFEMVVLGLMVAVVLITVALIAWRASLKRYASASS